VFGAAAGKKLSDLAEGAARPGHCSVSLSRGPRRIGRVTRGDIGETLYNYLNTTTVLVGLQGRRGQFGMKGRRSGQNKEPGESAEARDRPWPSAMIIAQLAASFDELAAGKTS
jgi:hypothetical protein